MINLAQKRYVVFGVANKSSICWAIAERLMACGGEVVLVSHPVMIERVKKIPGFAGVRSLYTCDVVDPKSVSDCFESLTLHERPIDGVVHGIAFSDKDELAGRFIDTSRENFKTTMEISCYSFIEIARRAGSLMRSGGSILTLSFDGSRGSYPHYNVMGLAKAALEAAVLYAATDLGEASIRVNAILASPEDTLSARGVRDFRCIGEFAAAMSPLGRRATLKEIANEAVYLLSPASSGVTGQMRLVDCGSSVPIMPPVRNARRMADTMSRIANAHEGVKPE